MLHNTKNLVVVVVLVWGLKEGVDAAGGLKEFSYLARALKFGDSCSWSDEEFRRNFTKLTANIPMHSPFRTALSKRFVKLTLDGQRRFCDAWELLVCSQRENSTCVCGDPGKESLFPHLDSSKDFIVEKNEKGKEECRWRENTYCTSPDAAAAVGVMVDTQCQSGSACISMEDGGHCSFAAIVKYVSHRWGPHSPMEVVRKMKEDLFSGKICACKKTTPPGAVPMSPILLRKKRTVVEEIGDHNPMTFVVPVLDYI